MDAGQDVEIGLDELHHRIHDIRDCLFMGKTLELTGEGRTVARIRPMTEEDSVPEQALVRNISFLKFHRRMFALKVSEGCRIVLTYHGRKMGVVEPESR